MSGESAEMPKVTGHNGKLRRSRQSESELRAQDTKGRRKRKVGRALEGTKKSEIRAGQRSSKRGCLCKKEKERKKDGEIWGIMMMQ